MINNFLLSFHRKMTSKELIMNKMLYFACFKVPDDQRASLLLPVDECFEKMTIDTFEQFGHNTAEHIVCSKNIKN